VERSQSWIGLVELAVATGVGYFLLARLGLLLRAESVAVFFPAAGLAIGALIALGPRARTVGGRHLCRNCRLQSHARKVYVARCNLRLI